MYIYILSHCLRGIKGPVLYRAFFGLVIVGALSCPITLARYSLSLRAFIMLLHSLDFVSANIFVLFTYRFRSRVLETVRLLKLHCAVDIFGVLVPNICIWSLFEYYFMHLNEYELLMISKTEATSFCFGNRQEAS